MLSRVDLPLPEAPEHHHEFAREQVEIHAAQGMHVDLAHAIDLGQAGRTEHGLRGMLRSEHAPCHYFRPFVASRWALRGSPARQCCAGPRL